MKYGILGVQTPETPTECKKTKCCHCYFKTADGCLDPDRLNRLVTLGF